MEPRWFYFFIAALGVRTEELIALWAQLDQKLSITVLQPLIKKVTQYRILADSEFQRDFAGTREIKSFIGQIWNENNVIDVLPWRDHRYPMMFHILRQKREIEFSWMCLSTFSWIISFSCWGPQYMAWMVSPKNVNEIFFVWYRLTSDIGLSLLSVFRRWSVFQWQTGNK